MLRNPLRQVVGVPDVVAAIGAVQHVDVERTHTGVDDAGLRPAQPEREWRVGHRAVRRRPIGSMGAGPRGASTSSARTGKQRAACLRHTTPPRLRDAKRLCLRYATPLPAKYDPLPAKCDPLPAQCDPLPAQCDPLPAQCDIRVATKCDIRVAAKCDIRVAAQCDFCVAAKCDIRLPAACDVRWLDRWPHGPHSPTVAHSPRARQICSSTSLALTGIGVPGP
jgi:hypothetical protein